MSQVPSIESTEVVDPIGHVQVIYLGPDQRGVPLEVPGFQDDNGHVTIIHAMRLRPSYKSAYKEVMRWL